MVPYVIGMKTKKITHNKLFCFVSVKCLPFSLLVPREHVMHAAFYVKNKKDVSCCKSTVRNGGKRKKGMRRCNRELLCWLINSQQMIVLGHI